MAEVENLTTTAAGIPKPTSTDPDTAELGTSPAQERSSNSHAHDSEYDTASDLEGEDEYEDDDGESDSTTDDGEDGGVEEDDDDETEDYANDDSVAEKSDEMQKKVDEDRSNPQYIPKRGTFYEHDDRTAEDADASTPADDSAEVKEACGTNPQLPTAISHASKTMRKWQPASTVERWAHDRFDPNEQAPKTRTELINAYGYDIRNEDAPPRARRRRRYGRGPNKYLRNWEDETAYLKASNTSRKPPKLSDFPALNERLDSRKPHCVKDEKENRLEKRSAVATPAGEKTNSTITPEVSRSDGNRENSRNDNKNKVSGRNHHKHVVRQPALEFKNKKHGTNRSQSGTAGHNSLNGRSEQKQQQIQRHVSRAQIFEAHEQIRSASKSQAQSKQIQSPQNDQFKSNREQVYVQMLQQPNPSSQNSRPVLKNPPLNLSARLQQVQNRNDPSHVGSVQMHALANANNQLVSGLPQQQQQPNMMIASAQQMPVQTTVNNHTDQGRPKRYSSIRRSQQDSQNLDQHQMQQLHMQQQQQQVPTQPLMLQDQHLLQANIMQLYHQENLQAQMQALQVSSGQQAGSQNPPTYAPVAPSTQSQQPPPPQPYAAAPVGGAAPAAFYVAAADAYPPSGSPQAPTAAQYTPQPPPNYLQNAAVSVAGTPISYASPSPVVAQQAVGGNTVVPVPTAGPLPYGGPSTIPNVTQAAPNSVVSTAGQPGYQNYSNFQNYNTVGGTTYFVPPAQATSRPITLPQRRPTNAIPILPPSEKNKQRSQQDSKEEATAKSANNNEDAPPNSSADNIDHIIDNMFVQRPSYQPPSTQVAEADKSASTPAEGTTGDSSVGDDSCAPASSEIGSQNKEGSDEKQEQIANEIAENANNDVTTEEDIK